MKEMLVDIATDTGPMETFIAHPEAGGPFPAVVIFQDVWGVREELYDIARRVGTVGYCAVVPDFYHRFGRVRIAYRDADNRMISLHLLPEEIQRDVMAAGLRLADSMMIEDLGALIRQLDAELPVRIDRMGGIGYCMGGRHVFRAAGTFPDNFKAVASLHGTDLVSDRPDSPHLMTEAITGALYCGFGELDRFSPPDVIEALDAFTAALAVDYRHAVHPGADHGYALPDRDIFDKQAAARDWELILPMFRAYLDI